MKPKELILTGLIVVLFFSLRLVGKNWDLGYHLHPDERMLLMVADRLRVLGPNKQLYPDFFNYGTFPIYVLRLVSEGLGLANYNSMLIVGRHISMLFDFVTLVFLYKITRILGLKKLIGFLTSFFYAIVFFAIQNSNFFVVDIVLTSLFTASIYWALKYFKKNRPWELFYLGVVSGLMMATKFSALLIIFSFLLIFLMKRKIKSLMMYILVVLLFMFLGMPYAFLSPSGISIPSDLLQILSKNPSFSSRFLSDIYLQSRMNSNPYIFPYTLQYVDRPAYWYFLVNIFWFGAGPIITLLGLLGLKKVNKSNWIIWFVVAVYFLVIGKSQVKFMRYLLPIYPFICLSAAIGLEQIKNNFYKIGLMFLALIYSLSFVSIYFTLHTRIQASNWMFKNIPLGSILAVEHWDDRLPIYNTNAYQFVEATWYDLPDNLQKERLIRAKINNADYYVLASNRLWGSLSRLADCGNYTSCYPFAAAFYNDLLADKTEFKKVVEFEVSPILLKIFNLTDQGADESFTVYDHPKIMIFKNTRKL